MQPSAYHIHIFLFASVGTNALKSRICQEEPTVIDPRKNSPGTSRPANLFVIFLPRKF